MVTQGPTWTQETEDQIVRAILQDRARRWGFERTLKKTGELERWVERQEHGPEIKADVKVILQELVNAGLLLPPGRDPGDERLLSANVEGGAMNVSIEASREWMLEVTSHLMNLLEVDAGANYVEWDIKPAGQTDPYRLILVRPGGKSPHELRLEAEEEVRKLREEYVVDDPEHDWPSY